MMKMLSSGINKGFARQEISIAIRSPPEAIYKINKLGIALYLGSLLSHLQTCLFEEKRDKQVVNLPLLVSLTNEHVSTFDAAHNKSIENNIQHNFVIQTSSRATVTVVSFSSMLATLLMIAVDA